MATLAISGTGDSAQYVYAHTIDGSGDHKALINSKNTFVDKNIAINITTPAAAGLSLSLTDKTGTLSMGTATDGVFKPTIDVSGTLSTTTQGWLTNGTTVADNSFIVGTVNESVLKNGNTAINSGATVNPTNAEQTINITEGYNNARTVKIGPISAGPKATVTSGTATISAVTYTYDETNKNFKVAGQANVSAPTVGTAGYVSTDAGTKNANANGAKVATTVGTVGVGVTASSTNIKVTPQIARTAKPTDDTWTDAASGAVTTTKPTSGVYVRVDAAAKAGSATVTGKVSTAGYGTTDHFTADTATTITGGSNAAASAYVPITAGQTAANSADVAVSTADSTSAGGVNISGIVGTKATSEPTSGYFLAFTGSGSSKVTTAGWVAAGDLAAASATRYFPITTAQFAVSNNVVYCSTAGYVPAGSATSGVGTVASGTITNNTTLASGATSAGTINRGSYIKIGKGYYANDTYYLAQANSGTLTITNSHKSSANISCNGYANVQVTGITVSKDKTFTLVTEADTALDTTSNITITNNAFRNIVMTNSGTATVTSGSKTAGTLTVAAYDTSSATATTSKQIVTNGVWATTTVNANTLSANTTYYGRVVVNKLASVSFANVATNGVTYTDVSESAPVLKSGDYLYVNAGYTGAVKISLAQLVPDEANIGAATTSTYILTGHSAYNVDGKIVAGSMPIYDGSYTVVTT